MAQTIEVYDQATGQWIIIVMTPDPQQQTPPERGTAQFIYDEDGQLIPYYPGSEH
jgi:hypothetical protein